MDGRLLAVTTLRRVSRSVLLRGLVLVLGLTMALASCVGPRDHELTAEREMADVVAEQQARPRAVPEAVNHALTPPRTPQAPEPERFDVSVRNVPARAFFLGLVEGTETNIVVHPNVSGELSLELKRVTVADVLEVARDVYGYEFRRSGNIYTIYPNELSTQVFSVNYLDVQRVGVSDTSLSIGRSDSSNGSRHQTTNRSRNTGNEEANLLAMLGGDDGATSTGSTGLAPGARVQTLNRTDFWRALKQSVSAIIGGEDGDRMVMVSPQAGMVVVKARPNELSAVREFLERSELSVRRQVILEAKILEVRLSEGFESGINWGAIGGELNYGYNQSRINTDGEQFSTTLNPDGTLSYQGSVTDGLQRTSEGLFTSILRVGDISDLLSLLETQGSVQVLSSPRVSTVNNQKAIIRVGSDEYFVTGISSNTVSNVASVTSTPNVELSSFFSGIALDVTPQIADEGEVILHIHPVVSEVTDQLKIFTVGDEEFALPLAHRGIRESDSIVRAQSGQVVVLGGLMQEDTRDSDGKRPILGDIPLLRHLFTTQGRRSQKTELVILLRPIVVDDDTWDEELNRSRERMQQMGQGYRDLWER